MAISSSSSSSSSDNKVQNCSKCLESFKCLQKNYDTEREKHNKAKLEIRGYEIALESLEARILGHEKNELAWGEKYEFQNYDLKCREIKINNLNTELEKVVKERDELKLKIEKWEGSSKNLTKILNSQMSAHDKNGLGFGTQIDELSNKSETDSENSMTVFEVRSSDEESTLGNSRFTKATEYHAVSPPITGNPLTPRADISFAGLDEYAIRNKIIESKTLETTKTLGNTNDKNAEKPKSVNEKVVSKTGFNRDEVIIEDWTSDDEEDMYLVNTVSSVKPNVTQADKNGQTSQKQGIGFKKVHKIKACFVCKSTGHLIKECYFYDQKSPEPRKYPHVKRTFNPSAVLTRAGLVNTVKSNVSTARSISTVRPVSTARPLASKIAQSDSVIRPKHPRLDIVRPKALNTPIKRSYFSQPVYRPKDLKPDVKTFGVKNMTTVGTRAVVSKGKVENVLKKDKWVWRPKMNYQDHVYKYNGSYMLKKFEYGNPEILLQDHAVVDSGCSSHMTGNKAYLSDYEDLNGGFVAFGSDPKGGKITGKGKIKTANLDFDDVYFVDELKFNLFSVSQMCDKKNSVLFTESECLILSPSFKLLDESQVVLRAPRKDGVYSLDLKNIVPSGGITCLYANATADESKLWHRRLGHVNFKNINKLVKGHLVRGLPSKVFVNDHTCVACKKGKQHKASCKAKLDRIIRKPLELLHMDLFGPVSIESINKKRYCLVVTDDFSRFSWVFFLATKDETSEILCNLIIGLEKQLNHNVKIIRCDNGTEFKNYAMNEFCAKKGIKREFSIARTPQQNARTMLADSLLPIPFWAEAVNTACYVLNRVLVTKPQNKTPYELLIGKSPSISFMRPFGCPLTILNTLDSLGKFDGKSDEGYLLGYSTSSKAFRVYNKRTKRVEENLHINFLEDQPNVAGTGPNWMFDLDFLTNLMNYIPVSVENQVNVDAGTQDSYVAGSSGKDKGPTQEYILLPLQPHRTRIPVKDVVQDAQEKPSENASPDKDIQDSEDVIDKEGQHQMPEDEQVLQDELEMMVTQELVAKAMDDVSRQAFEEEKRRIASQKKAAQAISTNQLSTDRPSVSTDRPSVSTDRPNTPILLCCTPTEVWVLVDLPYGKKVIGTKWVFRNKRDERSIVMKNKARLVAQGFRQEEGIGYDEVFAPVARIEAIRLFLSFASYMGFTVYQINVKSAFLYGTIKEEVYVHQNPGFVDLAHPNKVYKVIKALYGLHQAPKAWYETLSSFLMENGFRRGTIDKTLLIKKKKSDIMLVQVYVDDIIVGSTKKSMCTEFEECMHKRFQMSSMGELTFFLGLQVKQQPGGIFISQDKLISWQCKKQTIVANSTTKAEYVAAANCCGQSVIMKNPVAHSRTKHIEIRFHFIRDCYEKRLIEVIKIHTDHNVADLLTKGFDVTRISMDWRMDRSCAANSTHIWSYSDKHNMVAFLKKPNESVGFTEVVDFLKGTSLRYALTHNPTIYDSLVKQFWKTATVRTLANGTQQLVASIDSKEYTITEASVRSKLQLADAQNNNLSNAEIYAGLATLGYVTKDATGIHNLSDAEIYAGLATLGPKSGGWDQFGSTVATALICLSSNRVYNFSKMIFDGMVHNLESNTKFLMYPRFLQIILDINTESKGKYLAPTLTKKLFANMKRGYAGDFVPLLPAMLAGAAMDQDEGSTQPAEPHPTPVDPLPSTSLPPIPSPPPQSPPHQSPPH
ncbi:retrovirus-related pol polyprotein from transposon TNT 1-94 [Tanacetum coccineum]